MKPYIEQRVRDIAAYILETGATVRLAADQFKYSKSTVHKDMAERLWQLDKPLAGQVQAVLAKNKAERHLRGGAATLKKYRLLRARKKGPVKA